MPPKRKAATKGSKSAASKAFSETEEPAPVLAKITPAPSRGGRERSGSNVSTASVDSVASSDASKLSPKKRGRRGSADSEGSEAPAPGAEREGEGGRDVEPPPNVEGERSRRVVVAPVPAVFASGRTSSLPAPTMCLEGHVGAVYSCAFDHSGHTLATAGLDHGIFLWDTRRDKSNNFNVLRGHRNAVLQLAWMPLDGTPGPPLLASCSADKTVSLWDANKGHRLRKLEEHTGIVNCLAVSALDPNMLVSGSDDCTAVLWDVRQRDPVASLFHDYQVTSVAMSHDARSIYTGGIDNVIRMWDLRQGEPEEESMRMSGHGDTITGLSLSPDGHSLLSNSMDNTLRSWNVRPYVPGMQSQQQDGRGSGKEQGDLRCVRLFCGHTHGAEKALLRCAWSHDGGLVAAGSSDRNVHIWDADSCEPLYILPGHKGSVNEVTFHPAEAVVASCSTDKTVWLGELA